VDHKQPALLGLLVIHSVPRSCTARSAAAPTVQSVEESPGILCGLCVLCEATEGRRLCDWVVVSSLRRERAKGARGSVSA